MCRILIVDDDRIIRKGLVSTIDWAKNGFELIGEAADGEQGLEMIEKFHPNIVVCDIKMPFMDGLEMARIAREKYPMIKMILLTGYDDFAYAQQAIKVRAYDYLLKPVDKELLLDKVKQAAREWKREHKARQQIVQANPFFRQAFLKKLFSRHGDEAELIEEAQSLGIDLSGHTLIVFLLKIDEYYRDGVPSSFIKHREALKYCIANICEELIRTQKRGGAVELERDEIVLLYSSDESTEQAEENARTLAEYIKDTVKKYLKTTVTIAFGGACQGLSYIEFSYQEVRSVLNFRHFMGKDKVFSVADIEDNSSVEGCISVDGQEYELVHKVRLGLAQDALAVVDDLESEIMLQKQISLQHVRLLAVQLVISLFRGAAEWAKEWGGREQSVSDYYNRINSLQTISEIMSCLREIVGSLAEYMTLQLENNRCGIIGEAVAYIEQHYAKQGLSLQEIAKHVHMNPVYLSTLFKKEKSINFSEFLLQMRMNKAMELLREKDMKTYEVAEQVGYSSPEYFSVCFKKYAGVPPIEFKNKI